VGFSSHGTDPSPRTALASGGGLARDQVVFDVDSFAALSALGVRGVWSRELCEVAGRVLVDDPPALVKR
jgi:hypothetical protein